MLTDYIIYGVGFFLVLLIGITLFRAPKGLPWRTNPGLPRFLIWFLVGPPLLYFIDTQTQNGALRIVAIVIAYIALPAWAFFGNREASKKWNLANAAEIQKNKEIADRIALIKSIEPVSHPQTTFNGLNQSEQQLADEVERLLNK